jgi:hypothetical protein
MVKGKWLMVNSLLRNRSKHVFFFDQNVIGTINLQLGRAVAFVNDPITNFYGHRNSFVVIANPTRADS